jgi:predicted acetyltransferase
MQTVLRPALPDDQPVLANLVQLYMHDLRDFGGPPPDQHGHFPVSLGRYWSEPHHHAFLIHAGGALAGFALVCRKSRIHTPFHGHSIADFFVMRGCRGQGVGSAAAKHIFDMFPGRWELATPASNIPATAFWRSVSQHYTGGAYEEVWATLVDWRGTIESFSSPGVRPVGGVSGEGQALP